MYLEELRRTLFSEIEENQKNDDQRILDLIKEAFIRLSEIYTRKNSNIDSIQEYIEEKQMETREFFSSNISWRRKDEYISKINHILQNIEKMEEGISKNEISEDEGKHKNRQAIESIKVDEKMLASIVCMKLKDDLLNVNNKQKNLMDGRNISEKDIETTDEEAKRFIQQFIYNNQEKIEGILYEDDEKLKDVLVQQYEEYLAKQKKDKEKTMENEKDNFMKSLRVNINNEEEQRKDNSNGKEKSLPDLPDNILE